MSKLIRSPRGRLALLTLLFTQECSFGDITVTFWHSSGLTCSSPAPLSLRDYKHIKIIRKVEIGATAPRVLRIGGISREATR